MPQFATPLYRDHDMAIRIAALLILIASGNALAQMQVPNDFTAGQPARAAEVNENFDALASAVDQNASDISANLEAIQTNAAAIEALDVAAIDYDLQLATDYGRRGMSSGGASLDILAQLVGTLGLTCADANYGKFIGCTQLTAGDGTVWPIISTSLELGLAILRIQEDPSAVVYAAQSISGDMLIGGPANFTRGTYRDDDDVRNLVDDCDSPTLAMTPVLLGATNSRWRVNNGGYYYATDPVTPTGQIDVTGQMVGIVKNIIPFHQSSADSVVWCEMSDQVTGVYSTFELLPYPFNLNEARFSQPFTVD